EEWVGRGRERAGVGRVRRKEVEEWFYQPVWKEAAVVMKKGEEKAAQRWLIMEDEGGIGERIVAELERRGCVVTRMKRAERYERRGEREYWIRVGEAGDYKGVLKAVEKSGEVPGENVRLFSLSLAEDETRQGREERVEKAGETGFYSLVYVAQVVGQRAAPEGVELVVVGNEAAEVVGEEEVRAEKAVVMGPIRVISQEYPQ